MQIHIKTLVGKNFVVDVANNDTISHLKSEVMMVSGFPTESFRLLFAGKDLDNDENTISDYNMSSGVTLFLVFKRRSVARLQIHTPSNDQIIALINPEDNVDNLKKMILEKDPSIDFQTLRLVFGGQQLEEGHVLKEYGIEEPTCDLHLVPAESL
eukprot:GILI01031671.1.p1 GENE.GILI01031671.1~~GILI01031671.1.p1  ORF type:complete len:155 (-),score=27.69 GILI01031671.1:197-661(-)